MARREFTHDELLQAFQARRRASWPESFDEAMNDPTYRHHICIEARIRANRRAQQGPEQRQRTAHMRPMPTPTTPPVFDLKRRAAGERDDD